MSLFKPKKAAVLGCGPAGIFAAHGLIQNGWDVTIFSKAIRRSYMFGAQYLHEPIDGLTPGHERPSKITYRLEGSADGYRDKVYGAIPVKVSPESLAGTHPAWDIRIAYDNGFSLYQDRIREIYADPEWMMEGDELNDFKVVVSSVWLPHICADPEEHQFHAASVWAMGDAPSRGQYVPVRPPADTVVCDGTKDTGWYRAANVHGHVTVEWPASKKPPLPGVAEVIKPIYATCTCYTRRSWKFVKVGRYGTWSKGVLSHDAYTVAANL